MGLAASQAHLDLLSLRKSDLEYLVMQISDRRLQLTRDMESLAAEKAVNAKIAEKVAEKKAAEAAAKAEAEAAANAPAEETEAPAEEA